MTKPEPLNLKTRAGFDVLVSTVCLPFESRSGWYETVVFAGGKRERINRYRTEDEAQAGHAATVAKFSGKQASFDLGQEGA